MIPSENLCEIWLRPVVDRAMKIVKENGMCNDEGGRSAGFYRDKFSERHANESVCTPIKLEREWVSYASTVG